MRAKITLTLSICLITGEGIILSFISFAQEERPFTYYEIIEKRNFFRPREKKEVKTLPESKTTKSKKSTEVSSEFTLTGVVEIRGKFKAIIEKISGEGFYVEEGENIQDYLVEKITSDRVLLKKDNQTLTLKLKKAKSSYSPRSKIKRETKSLEKSSTKEIEYKPDLIQQLRIGKGRFKEQGGNNEN